MVSGNRVWHTGCIISGCMATLTALASVLVWASLVTGPAMVAVKLVKGHKANQRAARNRARNYNPGPRTYTIG